jgi:hypothetical protein
LDLESIELGIISVLSIGIWLNVIASFANNIMACALSLDIFLPVG